MNNYRQENFAALGLDARWLDQEHAKHANEYSDRYSSPTRYGLNDATVDSIEYHKVASSSVSDAWLKSKIENIGTVQIVFGKSEVCVLRTGEFLDNWESIFMPGRDDAIVLHNLNRTILFYCHEHEFEYGVRKR